MNKYNSEHTKAFFKDKSAYAATASLSNPISMIRLFL